jgi:GNAT superfamily N-acetyltransferase
MAMITAIVILDSVRRRSVGRRLMESAAGAAREAGCEGTELTTGITPNRADAHRFYEDLGHVRTSYKSLLSLV